MKAIHLITLALFVCSSSVATAQIQSADDWNTDRLEREQKAMKVLLIWGSTNLGVGVSSTLSLPDDNSFKWFNAMNAGFGAVNTTLGVLGLNRTRKQLRNLPTLEKGYEDLRNTRNILLVNAGLDVAYIVSGVLLLDQSGSSSLVGSPEPIGDVRRRGFGTSLIVQGAALLIFDSITAWQLSKSEIHISPVLTPNGAGIGFQSNLQKHAPQGVAWF